MPSAAPYLRLAVVLVVGTALSVSTVRPALGANQAHVEPVRARKDSRLKVLELLGRGPQKTAKRTGQANRVQKPTELPLHELDIKLAELELPLKRNFGDRVADAVTTFTGSWSYFGGGLAFFSVWLLAKSAGHTSFDNETLNLIISVATWAVGPLIMKYQSRQSKMDRQRQETLLLLLKQTEEESRNAQDELRQLRQQHDVTVADLHLKMDRITEALQIKPRRTDAPAAQQ